MKKTKLIGLGIILAFTAFATDANAQEEKRPTGVSVISSGLQTADAIGGSGLVGLGGAVEVGVTSRVSLGLSGNWYLNGDLQSREGATFDLFSPSVDIRASLIGRDHDLAFLLSPGLFRFSFDPSSSDLDGGVELVPNLGLGASMRFHLAGPLYLDFRAMDRISYAREDAFALTPEGSNELNHSLEVQVRLSALFRKKEASTASFSDLPVSYSGDFKPVDASSVTTEPVRKTGGREHMHVDQGQSIEIEVIEPAELAGVVSPRGASVVAPRKNVPVWEVYKAGSIFFDVGAHNIDPAYQTLIEDIATYLVENPYAQLELRGFTDTSGNARTNISLSQKRGTQIEERLVRLFGLSADRIDVVAIGADEHANSSQLARRVDLIVKIPGR